jgi:hypothetical protein
MFGTGNRLNNFVPLICGLTFALPNAWVQLPSIGLGPVNIELQDIATDLSEPIEIAYPNDGSNRLFIVELA